MWDADTGSFVAPFAVDEPQAVEAWVESGTDTQVISLEPGQAVGILPSSFTSGRLFVRVSDAVNNAWTYVLDIASGAIEPWRPIIRVYERGSFGVVAPNRRFFTSVGMNQDAAADPLKWGGNYRRRR